MIVHNMRFLLLNDCVETTRSSDRVAVDLAFQQDEDAGRDGEDRHNYAQARKTQAEQCDQPVQDEPDGQQQEAYIMSDVHVLLLSNVNELRLSGPATFVSC